MTPETATPAGTTPRLSRDEALHALTDMPLLELGELAQEVRFRKNPAKRVTYVIDTNPNYTNGCTVDCHFCAFYRKPGDAGGRRLHARRRRRDEDDGEARAARRHHRAAAGRAQPRRSRGSSTRAIVRESRGRYPGITPHFFSAPEIHQMAEVSGLDIRGVLDGAVRGRPALAARRRRRDPRDARAQAHLGQEGRPRDVARRAPRGARVGMRSTATMMYGHVETAEPTSSSTSTTIRALQDADARLHRVRALVVQARQHADGVEVPRIAGAAQVLPHAGRRRAVPRQLRPHPGDVVLRGQEDRPGLAAVRGRRLRRHAVRGERAHGHRPREQDHGRARSGR